MHIICIKSLITYNLFYFTLDNLREKRGGGVRINIDVYNVQSKAVVITYFLIWTLVDRLLYKLLHLSHYKCFMSCDEILINMCIIFSQTLLFYQVVNKADEIWRSIVYYIKPIFCIWYGISIFLSRDLLCAFTLLLNMLASSMTVEDSTFLT
jgi:hypothetical protein